MATSYPKSVVTVTGPLSTNGDADVFPTHVANRGWGGLHHADSVAEMYAITTERRAWGMQCVVYGGASTGVYYLRNFALGGIDNDLSNNNNWILETDINTGDYYVSSTYGLDESGRGSINKPYKTIQYAMQQTSMVGTGLNIIVRKGVYTINGADQLYYQGTITGEGATIAVNYTDANTYLIDNTKTTLTGDWSIMLYSGKLLRNTTGYGFGTMTMTGVKVYSNVGGYIDLQGTSNSASSSTASSTAFTSCTFNRFTSSGGNIEIFANDNMRGSWFSFDKCNFSCQHLTFRNDAFNGGTLFNECGFYGTSNFAGQSFYIKMGASYQSFRFAAFRNCNFDMLSLDGSLNSRGIWISEAGVSLSISYSGFSRDVTTSKYSIYSDYDYTMPAKFTVSGNPFGGTGVPTLFGVNGFEYIENLPVGYRF